MKKVKNKPAIKKKEKKDMNKSKKAQVSIEMIIILSVLILGAVVLASLLLGFFNKSIDRNTDIDDVTSNTVNSFIKDLVNYNDSNNQATPTPTPISYNLILTPNNPSHGTANTSGSYQSGSLVTVIANPSAGYSFVNWTVTSTGVVASTNASYSFNMPSSNLGLTANFILTPPINCTLSLNRNPLSGGTVSGAGTYTCNSSVTATATPAINYAFINWTTTSGTVTANPYTFNLNSSQTLTANFTPSAYVLNLTKSGSGNGTVTSSPVGISCGSSCTTASYTFPVNQLVTLTATPSAGHTFANWSGDCSGTNPTCTVTMSQARNVTATFNLPNTYLLSVSKENPLGGWVVSSGPTLGINCGSDCSESYSLGVNVSLTTTNLLPGYTFVEWRGACTGSAAICSFTMDGPKDVIAVFAPINYTLNVTKVNGAYGLVQTVSPSTGIICGLDCSESYFYGTNVTLNASGLSGGTFAGWSGAGCSGTGNCTVTMDAAKTVTASFNLPVVNYLLTVNKNGTGSGRVVSSTIGIDCGSTCSANYAQGTLVTLSANPDAGNTFTGWSGAGCSGTGNCTVTMDAAKTVTASFNLPVVNYLLTVTKTGNASGTVIGGPVSGTQINCGSTCSANYAQGTVISLTANPDAGNTFTGWLGDCSGTGQCFVTMDSAKNVTAVFNATNSFISKWVTNNSGESNSNQIKLPLVSSGTYNFTVYWGDGTTSTITTWNSSNATHTYTSPGEYTIYISGIINGFSFNNSGDRLKITEISKWGPLRLGNTSSYFYGASNLKITATDVLDLTGTTNLSWMFSNCSSITTIPSINSWNVSNVTNISYLFYYASQFNSPLNNWNVSNVTNMEGLFNNAYVFNQPLNNWNVSNVSSMNGMFANAQSFDQPLDSWNTSNVENMRGMFVGAHKFNRPLNGWNVSKVTDMANMFLNAWVFNQDLNNWNTSNVTLMSYMFAGASQFNGNIGNWNVSKVTTMQRMFFGASNFNRPVGDWNISSVNNMEGMFLNASSFNQPLGNWNPINVTNFSMFISNTWCCILSTANYDNLLIGWSSKNLKNNVRLDVGTRYSSAGETARQSIISNYNWYIYDNGKQ